MKLFSLVLLASAATAIPTNGSSEEHDNESTNSSRSVTQQELDDMAYYAQYTAASYCDTRIPEGHVVTCVRERNSCPKVTADNSTVLAYLDTDSMTGTHGMASYNPQANTIVVAFRGTTTVRSAMTDLRVGWTDCASALSKAFSVALNKTTDRSSECSLHSGFAASWQSVRAKTLQTIRAALAAHNDALNASKIVGFEGDEDILVNAPASQTRIRCLADPPKIVIAGHSLGGAVALLAATELRALGVSCDLYTYGMPRIGSEVFVDFVTKQTPMGKNGINNYRITHSHDAIPQVPPQDQWLEDSIMTPDLTALKRGAAPGYFHTSPEFWLDGDGTPSGDGFVSYEPSDVHVCEGYSNYDCNAQKAEPWDLSAHRTYFNTPMGDCHHGPLSFYNEAALSDNFPAAFGF